MGLSSSLTCSKCGVLNTAGSSQCKSCHNPLQLSAYLASHILFHGRYHIIDRLGIGGFGAVYKARDTQRANNLVAIKEICLRGLATREMTEVTNTFHREADLLSSLTHPNLPSLHEKICESEQWYLVMNYLEGETLEDYQNRAPNKRLMLSEVFTIGLQLCDILAYLHNHQPPIIFRDLKPANIILSSEKKVYVIDFGIARFFKPGKARDTIAFGSPGYAAPEQYGKAQTTPRADIYSLGAILHQLLTGKDPSESPLCFVPLRRKSASDHSDPGSLTDSMVEIMMNRLGTLIESMLEMDMNRRPDSVTLIKQELYHLSRAWAEIVRGYYRPRALPISRPPVSTTSSLTGLI
jgi:serine/threonine protein kinase